MSDPNIYKTISYANEQYYWAGKGYYWMPERIIESKSDCKFEIKAEKENPINLTPPEGYCRLPDEYLNKYIIKREDLVFYGGKIRRVSYFPTLLGVMPKYNNIEVVFTKGEKPYPYGH